MTFDPRHLSELRRLITGRVRTDVPLSGLSSFRIGGPADVVAEPRGAEELTDLLRHLHVNRLGHLFLGAGTNVLFSDKGFRGVVVRLTSVRGFEATENGSARKLVSVGAGEPLPLLVSKAARKGWKGLEKLWGIPGSFGGAICTNAGALGTTLGDLLERVELVTPTGDRVTWERGQLVYGYRSMHIPEGCAVARGTLALTQEKPEVLEAEIERVRARRRATQPMGTASAGCVFKNPDPERPAGLLIDRLGLKGLRLGDAQVSEIHGNFIVNRGTATAAEVLELIEQVRSRVRESEKLDLDLEVRIIGEEPTHVR
ncbi:MAG: UDP-N-acetylmuramate dehydrogenase [Thermodesulfobacteriota bacterium]